MITHENTTRIAKNIAVDAKVTFVHKRHTGVACWYLSGVVVLYYYQWSDPTSTG